MTELTGKDFADSAGHWYRRDGQPAYTIIGKNGRERNTTLRDAREHGLVPSVSTICRLEARPALERWKIEQACLACITLPRLQGESDDAFMSRALEDSRKQAQKAAERGTYLHGLIERAIGADPLEGVSGADMAIVTPVLSWISEHFQHPEWKRNPERSFAAAKFGGKIDLHCTTGNSAVVIDFKTKSGISKGKELAYDEHITQLAAYAYGIGAPIAQCINLFIDVDVPGLIVPKEWTTEERDLGWQAFSHLLGLWYVRKGL